VRENENLLLAARIWKIKYVDEPAKKIEVVPAHDGKRPIFLGGGGVVDAKVREKMLQLLTSDSSHPKLDAASQQELRELRQEFARFGLVEFIHERPVLVKEAKLVLYTFTSTRINRSLAFLLNCLDVTVPYEYDDPTSSFTLTLSATLLPDLLAQLQLYALDVEEHLLAAIAENPGLLDFAKWAASLPVRYQAAVLQERYFDFAGAATFLQELRPLLSMQEADASTSSVG
jgi:ATP-dependent Lhr-like helicase